MKTLAFLCLLITAPFWYPWEWIRIKLYYEKESKGEKTLRITFQILATIVCSALYIVAIWSAFTSPSSYNEDKWDRYEYYERIYEPRW